MIEIKQLINNEKDKAFLFAKKVYIECKDESYSEQGIETFCNFINNKEMTKSFKVYGAFENNILEGIIATDSQKRHICLFFVDKVSQGKGIGKELMKVVINNNASSFSLLSNCFISIILYYSFKN